MIVELGKLETLRMGGHLVRELPRKVGLLKKLRILDLASSTELVSLPGELGALPIKRLFLRFQIWTWADPCRFQIWT